MPASSASPTQRHSKRRANHAGAHAAIRVARERVLAVADRIHDPRYRKSFLEDVPESVRILTLAGAWLGGIVQG